MLYNHWWPPEINTNRSVSLLRLTNVSDGIWSRRWTKPYSISTPRETWSPNEIVCRNIKVSESQYQRVRRRLGLLFLLATDRSNLGDKTRRPSSYFSVTRPICGQALGTRVSGLGAVGSWPATRNIGRNSHSLAIQK